MKGIIATILTVLAVAPAALALPTEANTAEPGIICPGPEGEIPTVSARDLTPKDISNELDPTGLFKRDCAVTCQESGQCRNIGCGTCMLRKTPCGDYYLICSG